MAKQTTNRGIPFYAGGDPPAGMEQQHELVKWLEINTPKVHQGGTESRPSTREAKKLFWDSTTKELLYDDGTSLETAMPRTAAGDLAGTWPQPTLARVSSDSLPLHTDGARRLIRETRNLPSSATAAVELGSLVHQGVAVSVTLAYLATGVQRIARYEIAVVPTSDTGWRSVAQTVAAGSGSAAVRIEAREVDGVLSLRVREAAAGTGRSVVATIDVEGRSSSWTPASGAGEQAATASTWTAGGPVGLLPIGGVLDWPATTAPPGPAEWLELAGQSIAKASWPELFAAWGITGTSMNLPNRSGSTQIGAGLKTGMAATRAVGETGGSERVTLNPTQIPAHSHGINDPGHNHPATSAGEQVIAASGSTSSQLQGGLGFGINVYPNTGNRGTGITIRDNTNGGQPHDNMPLFTVTRYFVRAR